MRWGKTSPAQDPPDGRPGDAWGSLEELLATRTDEKSKGMVGLIRILVCCECNRGP